MSIPPEVMSSGQTSAGAVQRAAIRKVWFTAKGTFSALHQAEAFCASQGYSVGMMQKGSPCGLLLGDYVIAKWRNLTHEERDYLDGTLEGDFRYGPVVVKIKRSPPDGAAPPSRSALTR